MIVLEFGFQVLVRWICVGLAVTVLLRWNPARNFVPDQVSPDTEIDLQHSSSLRLNWFQDMQGIFSDLVQQKWGQPSLGVPHAAMVQSVGSATLMTLSLSIWIVPLILLGGAMLALLLLIEGSASWKWLLSIGVQFLRVQPSFVIGSFLVLVFAVGLNWLPLAFLNTPKAYVIPVLAIGLRPMCFWATLLEASISDFLSSPLWQHLKARGLSEAQILVRHALPLAMRLNRGAIPGLTASALSGSFVIEHLMSLPGLGQLTVAAMANRNDVLIVLLALMYALVLIPLDYWIQNLSEHQAQNRRL